MPSQTWVEPVVLEGSRVRLEPLRRDHLADLALVALDAPVWRWTIMGAARRGGPATLGGHGPRERRSGHRAAVRHDRPREGPADRQQPLHVDRAGAPAPRDRLDVDRSGVPTLRPQPRGEAAPADPCLRDARRQPGRVQDPRRNVQSRTALPGIGATFEGVPQPLDHARRLVARLRLVQRHRGRMAGGQGPLEARPAGERWRGPADRQRPGLPAFRARDIPPYGSDIGPRPVARANAVAIREAGSPGSVATTRAWRWQGARPRSSTPAAG